MRRMHLLGPLAICVGLWTSAARIEAAAPANQPPLPPPPSFTQPASAPTPNATLPAPAAGTPAPNPNVGPQIVLPPGTTIIVPPAPGAAPAQPAAANPLANTSGGCAECNKRGLGSRIAPRLTGGIHHIYNSIFELNGGIDGCLMPIGCSNIFDEYAFIFGSCRQYHGNGTASPNPIAPKNQP
jgi:hypothetical protein